MANENSGVKMKKLKTAYGIKIPRPNLGFMFNVEKGLERLKSRKRKSLKTAYLLAIFLGPFGAHHFYLNRWFVGVVYLLTFGILGIGWILDLFRISSLVEDENDNDETFRNLKSITDAYLMWFPCGIIGFHHFYMRNFALGFLYLCTFGVYGVGWVLDGFFMPSLVDQSNTKEKFSTDLEILKTYLIAASPFGILGGHQYYCGRILWGVAYTLTLGGLGIWWMIDLFRISALVHRRKQWRVGINLKKKYSDDVYLIWIWFGLLGGHHFYLKRYKAGFLYLFTAGCLGVGWLVDIVRIPWIVRDYNLDHLPKDELVFSDTFMESLSDFDRKEIQRVLRHARYSGEDNSIYNDEEESEENENFNQQLGYIRNSIRSLQRPQFSIGDNNESATQSRDQTSSKITTVAIISQPDESIAASVENEDRNYIRSGNNKNDDILDKNTVILNPNYLTNNGENNQTFPNRLLQRQRSECLNNSSYSEDDRMEHIKNTTKVLRVSFHIGDRRNDTGENVHLKEESNDHAESADGQTNNRTIHSLSETENQQIDTPICISRVKSEADIELSAQRKRKLLRSNTQITNLSWKDPLERPEAEPKPQLNNNNSEGKSNSLPRITKIRSIKKSKSRNLRKNSASSATQTSHRTMINQDGTSTGVERIPDLQNSSLPQGKCEKNTNNTYNNISDGVIHNVMSATLNNVCDDIEEIRSDQNIEGVPSDQNVQHTLSSSLSFRSVKDTGIGFQNVLPEFKPTTKRSMSFPSRQMSLEQDITYHNGHVLVIDDKNFPVMSEAKRPQSLRRSSTKTASVGWTTEENVQDKTEENVQEKVNRKRKKSHPFKITRAKSDAHTPVVLLEDDTISANTKQQGWT